MSESKLVSELENARMTVRLDATNHHIVMRLIEDFLTAATERVNERLGAEPLTATGLSVHAHLKVQVKQKKRRHTPSTFQAPLLGQPWRDEIILVE
jgi:hypothetical protein